MYEYGRERGREGGRVDRKEGDEKGVDMEEEEDKAKEWIARK